MVSAVVIPSGGLREARHGVNLSRLDFSEAAQPLEWVGGKESEQEAFFQLGEDFSAPLNGLDYPLVSIGWSIVLMAIEVKEATSSEHAKAKPVCLGPVSVVG